MGYIGGGGQGSQSRWVLTGKSNEMVAVTQIVCSLEKEAFETGCACLAKNTECTQRCGCRDKECANTAIQRRNALKLGVDVVEGNTWGMDCYTRRNIQDGEALSHSGYK